MLLDLSLPELAQELRTKKLSCQEIVRACYDNIGRLGEKLNAFTFIRPLDEALREARQRDKDFDSARSPLWGIPYLLKDSYLARGTPTTAASNVLRGYLSQYDATVTRRLAESGAILLGKTNMDAWGHGASSENTDFGPVRNPWDQNRVAGGSGGGLAAALAARLAIFGIGEDTGGSIRNPAAWCNITGLKVTYGRVSRYGCIAYASSFDTIGPTAKTIEDCAYVLEAIAGKDSYDASSSPQLVDNYVKELNRPLKDLTIGVPQECFGQSLDPEIKSAINQALKVYEGLGVGIKEISMPSLAYGLSVYYVIAPSETSSNLARYDGVRYGGDRSQFTLETMRRILVGTYTLSAGYYDAFYRSAQKARTLFIGEYKRALDQCDVLIMPVTATAPPRLGELMSDPLKILLADIYTCTQNPVGVPALAFPCGFTRSGLPIGMQLIGPMFTESQLFRLGFQYQQVTDWHRRKPNLT